MTLSETHARLLADAERAGRELIAVADRGEPGAVNRELVAALAQHGLLDPVFGRRDAMALCLLREGLARYCTEAETALALQGLGGHPILSEGRPELVETWVPRLAAGTAVAGFALTEPDAGSDVAALSLAAVRDGDGFRLTGEKVYISNAPDADVYSVFARTTPGAGARGITAFAVPAASAGLSGQRIPMLAPHPIGRLTFTDVQVPGTHVLGEVDRGMKVAMSTLNLFRPSVGAFAVGMGQAALDAAVAHAGQRRAFGRSLHEFQAVSHQLAEVATRLQAARLLVRAAAQAHDAGAQEVASAAAMAKLFATETAQFAVDVAIQVHGAKALEQGHPLEHLYREVRAPRIYEGASEIQREIIARALFPPT
ncbi:acyl-CoA dehydrogenase family protein [Amycolatopsis palatopharyngis]|uniref:acyl-CoA dehydrogenase family protein n=1 Tax=Amycolatopsis palatopharyngis TaxID=187982 RepID=UPI000E221598|nr:acyl-CoA dehydrogenase family protein [Amycolatopsis palatopharyngis]